MRLDRLGLIRQQQRGLTLVELVIAIALAGILTAGITMTFAHVFSGSTRTSNHMTAIRQVQSAGYWVSKDALQAQNVTPDGGDSGFPLTLTWEWEGTTNEVRYELQGTDLLRDYNGQGTVIAQLIESIVVEPRPYNDGKLTFTVTANVGGQIETRVYGVTPRPDP